MRLAICETGRDTVEDADIVLDSRGANMRMDTRWVRRRHARLIGLLLSVSILLTFGAGPATKPADSAAFQQATATLQAKRFKDARDQFAALAVTPSEAARALHGQGICELYLGDAKAASASLERARTAAGTQERALTYNHAVALHSAGVSGQAAEMIKSYLFAQPDPVDEPMLNALGSILQRMRAKNDQNAKSQSEIQSFYEAYNERVERSNPGMKRWGEQWFTESEVAERVAARDALSSKSNVAAKDLELLRKRVAEFRQELARNRKQGGGVRRTGDMDAKLSREEDELKRKQVQFAELSSALAAAEPKFSTTLFPLPFDASTPPPVGDAPETVAKAPAEPTRTLTPPASPIQDTPGTSVAKKSSTETPALPNTPSATSTPPSAAGTVAGNDGVTGNVYAVIDTPMDFASAKTRCTELGGSLVVIESEKENAFLLRYLRGRGQMTNFWIGLSAQRANVWKWVNNRPVAFKGWADREPNDNLPAAGASFWLGGGGWADDAPSQRFPFVCEWTDASKVPVDAEKVVADAAALDTSVPHEVHVSAKDGQSSRACSLGKFKRGETLMIQYVGGQWSAYPRHGLGSPDDIPLSNNVLPVTLCEVIKGQPVKIVNIPGNTAAEPFAFKIEKATMELVLNMQDGSPDNNEGAVTYNIWVKK